MDKNERRLNLKKFRDGKVDLLVSTDLAGRGLDLENVGRVINFHLPKELENYLHRAGRTARAGRKGVVVNLVTERDGRLMSLLSGKKPTPEEIKLAKRPFPKTNSTKTMALEEIPRDSKTKYSTKPRCEKKLLLNINYGVQLR